MSVQIHARTVETRKLPVRRPGTRQHGCWTPWVLGALLRVSVKVAQASVSWGTEARYEEVRGARLGVQRGGRGVILVTPSVQHPLHLVAMR